MVERDISRRQVTGAIAALAGGLAAGCAQPPSNQQIGRASVERDMDSVLHEPPLTKARLEALRGGVGAPALCAASESAAGREVKFASGLRMRGARAPVTTSDRWHIGSISKSITATLTARCVEAGLIAWTDTVESVLGGLIPDMREEYRRATFIHLLSHRAGLRANIVEYDALSLPQHETDARASRRMIARRALAQEPVGPLETSFLYSNSGYVVVGAMLETKLDVTWEDLVRAHVFGPLGMSECGFGAPGSPGQMNEPVGHASWFTQSITPHPPGSAITDSPAAWGPAGRINGSLDDILRFLAAHRDRPPFLRQETWSLLHTPPFGGEYALGWYVRPSGLWHNGTNSMWYAEAMIAADRSAASVAICNDGRINTVEPAVHAALLGALRSVA